MALCCVALWTVKVLIEAVDLMIWHHDSLLGEHISVWSDMLRMATYVVARAIMLFSFVARIHFSFRSSAYAYSKWLILCLMAVLFVDCALRVVCFSTYILRVSGNIIDRDRDFIHRRDWLFYGLVFVVVECTLFTASLIAMFIKPLIVMSNRTKVLSRDMLHMMTKYVILGSLCVLSSFAASVVTIFYISTEDLFVIWIKIAIESVDCVVSTWCTVLLFKAVVSWYNALCGPCHRVVEALYVKRFEKQGLEMAHL